MGRKPTPEIDRFFDKVIPEPNSGCWLWLGAVAANYGTFTYQNRQTTAHRASYLFHHGAIPNGLVLDHLCRNVLCVNPDHLEPVTQRVNVMRGNSRYNASSWQSAKTHCAKGHEYSPDNTKIIGNRRQCITCARLRRAAYKKRKPRTPEQKQRDYQMWKLAEQRRRERRSAHD